MTKIFLWTLVAVTGTCVAQQNTSLFRGQNLFNGQDLSGWEIYGTEKWYVENGELICESGPDKGYGYLATEEQFSDIDLTLEFLQEANGNSGVFFRSSIEGTKISGWQTEVAPPGHDTGGIYESYGRGWLIKPDKEIFNSLLVRYQLEAEDSIFIDDNFDNIITAREIGFETIHLDNGVNLEEKLKLMRAM